MTTISNRKIIILFGAITVVGAFMAYVSAAEKTGEGKVYSTWAGNMEMDRCASAWLIKRFVDKSAKFAFFPHGTMIKDGIPFDTPTAELRQSHNMSTFEVIVKKYDIKDRAIDVLGRIVRDIEINIWGEKFTEESLGVNAIIRGLGLTSKNEQDCLQKSFIIFDALYAHIQARLKMGKKGKK